MQVRERHVNRIEKAAVERAARAEERASQSMTELDRLRLENADLRADRDCWRAQAEKLGSALERLKAPAVAVAASAALSAPEDAGDLLYGVPAIAAFLGIRPRQAKHRVATGEIPTFRLGDSICARRSTLTAWLAAREATAIQGGN